MQKTLIAIALVSGLGAAQAQIVGNSTNATIVQVGASVVNAGPHQAGKPGVGTNGTGTDIIDLAGIDAFTYQGVTASSPVNFRRYQLLGYSHTPSGGTPVTTNFNWFKVPTITQEVYFGIATNPGTPTSGHAAFYVGNQTGYVVPSSATNYAAVATVATPSTSSTALPVLTGTLALAVSGAAPTALTGTLTGTVSATQHNLAINATTFTTPGSFSGTSTYYTGTVAPSANGTASGRFFGSGATSAVAGTASGTYAGSAYVAAFGGIKK